MGDFPQTKWKESSPSYPEDETLSDNLRCEQDPCQSIREWRHFIGSYFHEIEKEIGDLETAQNFL